MKTDHKPPSLASYISLFGWLSFLAAFGSFVGTLSEAGAHDSTSGFWLAWGVCAVWCVVGLLLLAVAKALFYLSSIAHSLGEPNAARAISAKIPSNSLTNANVASVAQYHVSRSGKDLGAMPVQRIRQMLNSGQLAINDVFFDPHSNDWLSLDLLPG